MTAAAASPVHSSSFSSPKWNNTRVAACYFGRAYYPAEYLELGAGGVTHLMMGGLSAHANGTVVPCSWTNDTHSNIYRALQYARGNGTRIQQQLTMNTSWLTDSTVRSNFVSSIKKGLDACGAHGFEIDWEGHGRCVIIAVSCCFSSLLTVVSFRCSDISDFSVQSFAIPRCHLCCSLTSFALLPLALLFFTALYCLFLPFACCLSHCLACCCLSLCLACCCLSHCLACCCLSHCLACCLSHCLACCLSHCLACCCLSHCLACCCLSHCLACCLSHCC